MKTRLHSAILIAIACVMTFASCGTRKKSPAGINPDGSLKTAENFDQHFIDACVHFNNANFPLALKMFQKCNSMKPGNPAVLYYLSRTLTALGNESEGIQSASSAWNGSPDNVFYAGWYSRLLKAAGNPSEAIRVLEKTNELKPSDPEIVKQLDSLYASVSGTTDKRIKLWENFRSREGDKIYILQNLAGLYETAQDFNRAHTMYNRIKELSPTKQQTYIQQGMLYMKENNVSQALENFEKALQTGTERFIVYKVLFSLYAVQGDRMQATGQLRKAFRENSAGIFNKLEFCQELSNGMKTDTGLAFFAPEVADILQDEFPDHPKATLYAARMYAIAGKNENAQTAYLNAVRLDPGSFESWLDALKFCKEQGLHKEQLAYALDAMEYFPGISVLYLNAAYACNGMGRYPEAEKYCNDGLSFVFEKNDSLAMLTELGIACFGQNLFSKALSVCEQGLETDPGNPRLLELSGDAYSKLGNREKAVEQWKKARAHGAGGMAIEKKISSGLYDK